MYRFNLAAIENGVDQLWTGDQVSDTGGNFAVGYISSSNFSNISFPVANGISGNRNIVSGTANSLCLSEDAAEVTSAQPYKSLSLSMVFHAGQTDLWLIKFDNDDYDLGVKLNQDYTLSLHWVFEEAPVVSYVPYIQQTTYLHLSFLDEKITIQVNDQTISLEADSTELQNFSFGGGLGGEPCLVDKIAVSRTVETPKLSDYADILKPQRLDIVPRPDSRSTFVYLNDVAQPDRAIIRREDFQAVEGIKYYTYLNNRSEYRYVTSLDLYPVPIGRFEIIKRSSFDIEYSVDKGETWFAISTHTMIENSYDTIMFRHESESDEDYILDIRNTYSSDVPMAFYDLKFDGAFFMPPEVGMGYYDSIPGNFSKCAITISDINYTDELINSNFETLDGLNWNSDDPIELDYSVYLGGTASLTILPEQTIRYGIDGYQPISVDESSEFSIVFWAKRSSILDGTTHTLVFKDFATNTTLKTINLGSGSDNDWQRVSETLTIPTGTDRLKAEIVSDHTEGYIWVDSLLMREVGATPVVRTVEMLASFSDAQDIVIEASDGTQVNITDTSPATGYTVYTNGVADMNFSDQRPGQLYHILVVFDTAKDWVVLNPRKTASMKLVGVGASDIAYDVSDALDIYVNFIGYSLIMPVTTGPAVIDAESPNSEDGKAAAALDLQWSG